MKIGAIFPQTEFGNDPAAMRDYAQAVEDMGYHHILVYDHVLGAELSTRPDWKGPYNSETPFHEIFVLFGYLAAVTREVELVTGVVILPQRQTVLVAKQAAEVDVLSGGRMRLGVGIGWNKVEYDGLNEDFHTRGARLAEQVELMRALWKEPVLTFQGKYHHIEAAGINPLPVRRSIPVWFGGHAEPMLKRIARLGDGWFPLRPPGDEARRLLEQLHMYAREAGRSPGDIGLNPFIHAADGTPDTWQAAASDWEKLGATHLSVNTMRAGLRSPQEHIDTLRRMKEALGVGAAQ